MVLQIEALFEKIVAMAMFSRRALQNAIDESLLSAQMICLVGHVIRVASKSPSSSTNRY